MLARIAEFNERPGGSLFTEILVAFLLMLVGAGFYTLKIPKADDAIMAGITLIGRAMVGVLSSASTPEKSNGSHTKSN